MIGTLALAKNSEVSLLRWYGALSIITIVVIRQFGSCKSSIPIIFERNRQKVVDLVLPRFTEKNTFPYVEIPAIILTENSGWECEQKVLLPYGIQPALRWSVALRTDSSTFIICFPAIKASAYSLAAIYLKSFSSWVLYRGETIPILLYLSPSFSLTKRLMVLIDMRQNLFCLRNFMRSGSWIGWEESKKNSRIFCKARSLILSNLIGRFFVNSNRRSCLLGSIVHLFTLASGYRRRRAMAL